MEDRKNQKRGLESVCHFFLSAPKPSMVKERVTIQVAARTLGVSKGRIITYLNEGLLTRIKEDGRVYIDLDEVNSLAASQRKQNVASATDTSTAGGRGAAGLPERGQTEQPVTHLRRSEKKRSGLLTTPREVKHSELENLKIELDKLKQNLAAQTSELVGAKIKIKQLEEKQQEGLLYFNKAKSSDDNNSGDMRARLTMVEEGLKRLDRSWWKRLLGDV